MVFYPLKICGLQLSETAYKKEQPTQNTVYNQDAYHKRNCLWQNNKYTFKLSLISECSSQILHLQHYYNLYFSKGHSQVAALSYTSMLQSAWCSSNLYTLSSGMNDIYIQYLLETEVYKSFDRTSTASNKHILLNVLFGGWMFLHGS